MAVQKIRTIRLTWKNDDSFIMETKKDDGDWLKVTGMDENDYFKSLWSNTQTLCEEYFKRELNKIGAEMKS